MNSLKYHIQIFFFTGLCLLFSLIGYGQKVTINEPPTVKALMDRFIELNREKENLDGWRIQIIATDDKRRMELEKRKFEQYFPGRSIYWVYETPYYKLRIGAFSEKLEVERHLNEIRKKYPSAYAVRVDDIEPDELLGS